MSSSENRQPSVEPGRGVPTLSSSEPHPAGAADRTVVSGDDGEGGEKAFFIRLQARPGAETEVEALLVEIYGHILCEPATGPWFGCRYGSSTFIIFEAFPDLAGRDAHVRGRGGDIFRDAERLRRLLARSAEVFRLDVLKAKLDTQLPPRAARRGA